MDIYILDSLFRQSLVADRFESLVWAERFSKYGDFKLTLHSTLENKNRFRADTKLSIDESRRVMVVETVEDKSDSEGKTTLIVSGRSLEKVLEDRMARGELGDLTTVPKWSLEGLPAAIARKIYHDICALGLLNLADALPTIGEGSAIFPDDTIPEPSDEVLYEIDPMTVYKAISDLCDVYDMGFRIVRDPNTSQLYFDIYMGSDRTTQQTSLPAVVFSPDMDNLQNTTELSTVALYKNVAYVISPVGHATVYAQDIDTSISGFDRRVLTVVANDITDEDPEVAMAKMIQRGKEELAKNRLFSGFDGELNSNNQYKYGIHYNLGDLVEKQSDDGTSTIMQVTEQIITSDAEGDKSYPTLSINRFITPGSWLGWDYNQEWDDLGSETWVEQP